MERGLVQKKRGKPKKRALVNSNNFCRLTRRSVVDKDDAIRLISDTCMENFSVLYVNEDFNVEDDLLSVCCEVKTEFSCRLRWISER